MTDTDRDAYEHLGRVPTPARPPLPTADDCYARAAEALAAAGQSAMVNHAGGAVHTTAAQQWMHLAHELREHGPAEPIDPASLSYTTVDDMHGMARAWPRAFAEAVHALISEYTAEIERVNARSLEHKARAEQVTAERDHLNRRFGDLSRLHQAAVEDVRTLKGDLERVVEMSDAREADHEAERRELRADYDRACKTIADMHAAAFGGEVRGPNRGVVEDVADLYARCQAAEEALTNAERRCTLLRADFDTATEMVRRKPEPAANVRPGQATGELARLREFITALYPDYATEGPIVPSVIDLLNTHAARTAVVTNRARDLLSAIDRQQGVRDATARLREVLDTEPLAPRTVTVREGRTAVVRGFPRAVPPVGRPTTLAEAATLTGGGIPAGDTPHAQVHVHEREPAEVAWRQAMADAARREGHRHGH